MNSPLPAAIQSGSAAFTLLALVLAAPLGAQQDRALLAEKVFATPAWREIGPVNYTGRIVDLDVDPRDRSVWYVASATGGIWKTENEGASFRPLFTDQKSFSIGDIAIAPSAPDTLYVGTGEANNQRSSYFGDGVYKSTDGGKTFANVGLAGTDHIGRIAVHPTNAEIVFVAAAGALYRANEERGLYRSKDGGKTWERKHHVNADTGFIDVCIDPANPDRVLAASYDRRRRAWHLREGGEGSRVWLSEDGGETWNEVRGIPDGTLGRIGIAFAASDSQVAYAIVENLNPAPATRREEPDRGERERDREPAPETGTETEAGSAPGALALAPRPVGGEVYRSADGGKTWKKASSRRVGGEPHYYYGQIRVDPRNADRVFVLGVNVSSSDDGGKTWKTSFGRGLHVDHHALWLDPNDSGRALLGNDGGLALTYDGGRNWRHYPKLPIGQIYSVGVDLREPYTVYGGTQDNGTWGIPSRSTTNEGLGRAHAMRVDGGDGFCVQVDPQDPDVIYTESQFGGMSRQNLRTGARRGIRPSAPRGSPALRFNWMTPILLSPHNPHTVYTGSQLLHRSRNRGDDWETISHDLTTADSEKLAGNVPHCTITTIDESPVEADQLWVGTDDGKVWTSRNGGRDWIDLSERFPGLPPRLWVSRVACSPHDAQRAYVAFTGYREDDRRPYLYLTVDGGTSFTSIVNDLPAGESINVVREHPRNPDCVIVGTEFGVRASVDGGGSWYRLGTGLPTVAVHDLLVHPREEDLVIGTHGRGCWILDATMLAELGSATLGKPFHLFAARDGFATRRVFPAVRYPASPEWRAAQPSTQAQFRYWIGADLEGDVTLRVLDATGRQLWSTNGSREAGLHEIAWGGGGGRGQRGGFPGFGGQGPGNQGGAGGGPGQYRCELQVGDQTQSVAFTVHPAPGAAGAARGEDELTDEGRERDY
ncbi:MAG: hypothetical protein IT457_02425 [Planctomycetes bacterium]|nr:hypothetical protein [Planctomycetota bacterium]